MTKQAIYSKYGIEFKEGKINYNGTWINELLKQGNSKTGKNVWTFSMMPGNSGKGTCACNCVGCYAMTGFYRMNSVIASLELNTDIVNNDIDFFYRAISAQLECIGRGEIRIHAAGDFNTRNPIEYANTWHRIASENSSFIFWTYTKVKQFESLFDDLNNANIVKSVIPGVGINYGKCEYIINAYLTLKEMGESVYICKCGIDKKQHCENCGVCANYKYVLFIEHSTDYKAETDPMFDKVKELIARQ